MSHYSKEVHAMLYKVLMRTHRIHEDKKIQEHAAIDLIDLSVMQALQTKEMGLKDLLEGTDLTRHELQKSLALMVKKNLLNKVVSDSDKRMSLYHLTQQGELVLDQALDQLMKPLSFALGDLSLNEEKAVLKYLSRLHQGLKQLETSYAKK